PSNGGSVLFPCITMKNDLTSLKKRKKIHVSLRQIALRMKILSFLLMVCTLHISAKSLSQTVTIHTTNERMATILQLVKKQTGYNFLYNNKVLVALSPVTISADEMPLANFLYLLLTSKNLTYTLSGKNILISKDRTQPNKKPAE